MCLVLSNDLNQLYQQHRKAHYSVAVVTFLIVAQNYFLKVTFLILFGLQTLSKWIYRTILNWKHLMQLKISNCYFYRNKSICPATYSFDETSNICIVSRLPLSSLSSSFCLNKIYLLSNLLIHLLLYSLVYLLARSFLSGTSQFYFKTFEVCNVSTSSNVSNKLSNISSDISTNAASFNVSPNVSSNVQQLFLVSFLSSYFLEHLFLSLLSFFLMFLKSRQFLKFFKFLNLSTSTNCRTNLKSFFYFQNYLISPYELPNFRFFFILNKLFFIKSLNNKLFKELCRIFKMFKEQTEKILKKFRKISEEASEKQSKEQFKEQSNETSKYLSKELSIKLTKDKKFENKLKISKFINPSRSFWIIILVLSNLNVLCQSRKSTLYTAGFFPLSGNKAELGLGILPAVQLALDDISDNDVIPGHKLDLVGNDTMCDAAVGMKTFFDMIFAAPKKLILFGDACPAVTDPIAKASRFFHLIQLSYADTHPMYTADSYPNLFRISPSQSSFNKARVALLQQFDWRRVGTLYENSPRYSLPHGRLLTELDLTNITIATTQSVSDGVQFELVKIKEKDVRIILGNFGESWAKRIFCQAYRLGIYGRRYQWIIAGEYSDFWWTKNENGMNCSTKELLKAIEGYILIDVLPLSSSQVSTASGMTAAEYEEKYNYLRKDDYSKFHGYAYDGLWTIALAIRRAQTKLKTIYTNTSLQNFQYRDPFWSKLFRDSLSETFFIGVTGNVSFHNNERKGSMVLKQMQKGREVKIGEYHSTTDNLDLSVGLPISWGTLNNTPPLDRTIKQNVASRISLTLFVVISIFAIMGILLALFFLFMNIKNRKQRYIKMSSPYLNNLIIIGCVLTYTSVILLGLDSRLLSESNFPYICTARAWVLMTGFTLAFGSMFSKTYRVHAIFTDIKLNKKVIKDYKLFMVVGILVFIDVATLITWQILDPFYRQTSQGVPETTSENEDTLIVPQLEYCQSKRMTIFLGAIYVYKGLLMAFGIFLSWETRHVSIPALNDSKYIGMSVYNVVIMCVLGAGLSVVLKDQQNAAFLIISIFIIFCSTATLCLVFVPKLIELKRNPNDERRARPTLKPFKKSRRESDELELCSKIKNLSETNVRQRQRLKEKTYELEALMYRLRQINAEVQEEDSTGQLIAKVNIENIPEANASKSKLPVKPIDSNRLSTSQLYSKHGCVVLAEESSSRSNDRETSFLSLSASASFVSSNENCAIYAHQTVPQTSQFVSKDKELMKPKSDYEEEQQTDAEKRLLYTANSELLQEVLDGENLENLHPRQHLTNQRSSCPELYQVQQLLSLDNNQLNKNCMEKLMMLNTTTITSAIIETDSSSEIVSSSSDERTSSDQITTIKDNLKANQNLIQTSRSTKQANRLGKKDHYGHVKSKAHKQLSSSNRQHVRRRMVKAISQVEPLSLIEKVREIRFAVQRSLDADEQTRIEEEDAIPLKSKKSEVIKTVTKSQKPRKKKKEQSISSCIKSLSPTDQSHLSSHQQQDQKDHLPSYLNDQIIHETTELHTDLQHTDTHHSKSIYQHSSKFNKSSTNQQYFKTQADYANDQLDYNLNLKNFKLNDDEENRPLSCDHQASFQRSTPSNSSSSSSSPSTMLGRAPIPTTFKYDYNRMAKNKQIDEEDLNKENVYSAKKQRTLQHQDLNKQQQMTICSRHPYTMKRRAVSFVSLDQLQTNQLCTCTRQHHRVDYEQQFRQTNLDPKANNISTIYRGPFNTGTNLPDSSLHYINSNRLTSSITTHTITSHQIDSSIDRNQQNRLPMTSNHSILTSTAFSSSPSIKCDIVEYL